MCAIIGVVGLFARCANCATTAAALSVTPSTKWSVLVATRMDHEGITDIR